MTGPGRGQEDLEVKVKSSKTFSVISDGKDGKEEGKKYKSMNESIRSEIRSEIDYTKSAEFIRSNKMHESDNIKTELDKSESKRFHETNVTIKTELAESKSNNESKKFQDTIKTEITSKSKNRYNSYGPDIDEDIHTDEYSDDFDATVGSQMRESVNVNQNLKQSKDFSVKPDSARNKMSMDGVGVGVGSNTQPMKKSLKYRPVKDESSENENSISLILNE